VKTVLAGIMLGVMAALQCVAAALLAAGDVGAGPLADAPGRAHDAAALDVLLHLGVTLAFAVLEIVAAARLLRRARGAQILAVVATVLGGAMWLCCGLAGVGSGAEAGGTGGVGLAVAAVCLCLAGLAATVLGLIFTLSAETARFLGTR